ncbi:tyrosine-type recombinase/integrase [Deinococcus marmoris]|uniref:tyrosine-type recombinase/integrase n=1 Tax=Deinococcus marmoris TaxID=249408 RepID=UPI00096AAA0C|nr:site-specific integrase [Deinococcus marmoris]
MGTTGVYKNNIGFRWHLTYEGCRYNGTAPTAKEAELARAQKLAELSRGLVAQPTQITFGEQLETWLQDKDRSRAKRTSLGYRYSATKYISDRFKALKLKDLRPSHVRQLYVDLQDRGVTEAHTLRLTHAVVHGVLEMAFKDELMVRNPARGQKPQVTSKDTENDDLHVFSPSEAARFAAACDVHSWGMVFKFMLLTGVRRGEACGLAWTNVFLDAKLPYVRIEQALHCAGKEKLLTRPKTKTSRRTLYLSPDAVEVLLEAKRRQSEIRQRLGDKSFQNDFVFTSSKNADSLGPDNLKNHMNSICKAADVPRIRIHDLRHTFASLSLRVGVRVEVLSRQLGHASPMMTLNVYRHIYHEEMQQNAIPASVLFGQVE